MATICKDIGKYNKEETNKASTHTHNKKAAHYAVYVFFFYF